MCVCVCVCIYIYIYIYIYDSNIEDILRSLKFLGVRALEKSLKISKIKISVLTSLVLNTYLIHCNIFFNYLGL